MIFREVQIEWDFIDWEFLATILGLVGPRMSDGRYYAKSYPQ